MDSIYAELYTHDLLLNQPTESDLEDITAQINTTEEIPRNIFNIPNPDTPADTENGWRSATKAGKADLRSDSH